MTEPERQVAVEAGQTKTPERAPGHRELKPPEWFEERLATWVQRMGLNAWTIRTSCKPKLRGAEGYAEVSPTFLEAELQFSEDGLVEGGEQVIHDMVPRRLQREARASIRPHEESVVEAIAHALVRTAEQTASKPIA